MWKKNKGTWKMKDWLAASIISMLAVFAPIKELLVVSFILIFVDLVTGVLAARKRGEWTTLSTLKSAGLRRTITKLCVYMTAICVGWLIENFMLEGFIPVSKLAAGLISVVEGKSIFENLDTINGNPIFQTLINKLGSVNDVAKVQPKKIQEKKKEEGESL